MDFRIDRCFDSHVHLLETGEHKHLLDLTKLKRAEDLTTLKVTAQHKRGEWILGRGWDQNKWPSKKMPDKKLLDQLFPQNPVCFTRVDGHAIWVNQKAIDLVEGLSSDGILIDKEMMPMLALIPEPSRAETKNYLQTGIRYFHKSGFTHLRELTCSQLQFELLRELEVEQKLNLAIELFFDANPYSPFDAALKTALAAKAQTSKLLRVKGIKFFYDGALGSEGALLSCCYPSGHFGLRLMQPEELKSVVKETWANDLEPAIHVIGDQAAHEVALVISDLAKDFEVFRFHLEHAEILRPDTIELLKSLPAVIHFQPCHWHSDKKWLKEKLGALEKYAFPIAEVELAGIEIHFGSDSPVEEASVWNNQTALEQIAALREHPLSKDIRFYHSHPDADWLPLCWTEFKEGVAKTVFFEEKIIYSRKV